MIDTHAHLYLKEFEEDIDDVLHSAIKEGVKKIYLPAVDSETTKALLGLEAKYPDLCRAMIGLHPCSVKENYTDELAKVKELLSNRAFSAIGEAGLDFYWDTSYEIEQYLALEQQIRWAVEYDIPLILHTRNATRQTIDFIRLHKTEKLRGIFHCFGGSLTEALEIIDLGFYLGIGGVVTYKNAGLAEVIKDIDIRHLVLETDAPYLAPVPFRGKRNETAYLKYIAEKIAVVKGMEVVEVVGRTTENAEKVFNVMI